MQSYNWSEHAAAHERAMAEEARQAAIRRDREYAAERDRAAAANREAEARKRQDDWNKAQAESQRRIMEAGQATARRKQYGY